MKPKTNKKLEEYTRYLESTTAEERAQLEKEGLGLEAPGQRVAKKAQSFRDVQAVRLEKLMDNFDTPIEMPQPYEDVYEPQARIRQVQGAQQHAAQAEYHVYRLSKRKEFALQEVQKMQKADREAEEIYQEQFTEKQRKLAEQTAKKRAKWQKKKQNKLIASKQNSNNQNQQTRDSDGNQSEQGDS
jgi:hypothetical protein